MNVFDTLFALTAAVCWTAAGYRLRASRRGSSRAGRAVTYTLVGCGVVMVLQVRPIIDAVERTTALPSSAQLLGHLVGLACAVAVQTVLVYVVTSSPVAARRRVRRRTLLIAAAITGLVALFLLSPDPPLRDRLIQPSPSGLAYAVLFTVALGLVTADVTRLAWWGARISARPYLRLGLRLIAVAGALTVAYTVIKNVLLVARFAGRPESPAIEQTGVAILIVTATLLFAVGATVPSWGPRTGLRQPVQWLTDYQDHRGLHPLWLALYRAEPRICLDQHPATSRWADVRTVRRLGSRVYRRVIEIRDGLLLLRPWFAADVAATARRRAIDAGLDGDEITIVSEASSIAAALAARASGGQPGDRSGTLLTIQDDMDGEIGWLRRVAAAYHRSPIVHTVRAEANVGRTRTAGSRTGPPT